MGIGTSIVNLYVEVKCTSKVYGNYSYMSALLSKFESVNGHIYNNCSIIYTCQLRNIWVDKVLTD